MESRQVIGFLITVSRTDVIIHTCGTEGTLADGRLDLIQNFTLGVKTWSVEVGSI